TGIKGERVEIGLGLLEMSLARDPLALLGSDERTYRQLGERHGRNERLARQHGRVREALQENHGRGVEDSAGRPWSLGRSRLFAHILASRNPSISARRATWSTGGSRRHRPSRASADSGGCESA